MYLDRYKNEPGAMEKQLSSQYGNAINTWFFCILLSILLNACEHLISKIRKVLFLL